MLKVTLGVVILATAVFYQCVTIQPAHCSVCVASFCGFSSDCMPGCFCAIPNGKATGTCMGTQ